MNEIGLRQVYEKVEMTDEKVDKLAVAVGQMVAINQRLDQHHDQLAAHSTHINTLRTEQAVIKTAIRPRTPWYSIAGGIASIIGGIGSLVLVFKVIALIGSI